MPQAKELRMKCFKERDEIMKLNYTFFGYVASHTFINNSSITYEDKLQSALMHFCECFWWYKWKGDSSHKGYRDDLSFAVFFKPRIGEMIERELNEVKYSVRRSLCMEAAQQLGKHWAKVTYDDLKYVNLPADKMNSLKAIFGSLYIADLADHEAYLESPTHRTTSIVDQYTDMYDSVEDLLIHEMVGEEKKLSDKDLRKMSEVYGISFETLKDALPTAEERLYAKLRSNLDTAMFDY